MNKRYRLLFASLLTAGVLSVVGAQAQAPSDGYRNSLEGVHGTARAQSMSGAVGALGADPTAIWINPAGSALYLRGALSLGLEGGRGNTSIDYRHENGVENTNSSYGLFDLSNISYIGSGIGLSSRPLRINWGFLYNRDYSYKRDYKLAMPLPSSGITDYLAFKANESGVPIGRYMHSDTYDPRLANVNQSVVMGLNAWLIEGGVEGKPDNYYRPNVWAWAGDPERSEQVFLLPDFASLSVKETGGKNSFDLNFGVNYDDRYFFGATLRSTASVYSRHSEHSEDFYYQPKNNRMGITYDNDLHVTGGSVGLNLGALVAIGDYGRVGISYLLPQYATYTETYSASASYYNDHLRDVKNKTVTYSTGGDFTSKYDMWLPGKLTLSAMAFLSRYGMVTYDFTYRNLGSAKYMLPGDNSNAALADVTDLNKQYFGGQYRHSVGLEVRPLDWLTLRTGYSHTSCGIKMADLNPKDTKSRTEYSASGMILDYTLPRNYQTASAGIGFQFGSLALDLAYVYSARNESVYPYPALPNSGLESVTGGSMKDTRNSVAATVTLSF